MDQSVEGSLLLGETVQDRADEGCVPVLVQSEEGVRDEVSKLQKPGLL